MKKIYFLVSIFLFFLSCSNDDNQQPEEQITACFEISKDILEVGEELQITNCSVGANSYEFDFGNGITSNEDSPLISYQNSGEYTIELKITSKSGKVKKINKTLVINEIEGNYLYTPVLEGDYIYPINFDYVNNTFYYIEYYWNIFSTSRSTRNNYVEIDISNNKIFTKKFLADRESGSNNAFLINLSNNDKLIYTTRSTYNSIGLTEIKLDASLQTQSAVNNSWRVLYGFLEDNSDYLYYGSYRNLNSTDPDYSSYKSPSIEIRNSLGEISVRKTYNIIEQGFIGDLVKTDKGFIAFGGMIDPVSSSTFENYRPIVIFLDNNYEYIDHKVYNNSEITIIDNYDLDASFHISKLTNANYVIYSHNEFRIINSKGDELTKVTLPEQSNIQALTSIENEGFILSSKDFLHKYDLNGNLMKSLKFKGHFTPNLVLKDNKIFFASGYHSEYTIDNNRYSVVKTFFGVVDTDLNIINLN